MDGPEPPASVSEPTGALAAAEPVTEPATGDKIMKKRSSVHAAAISPLPSALVSRTGRRRKFKQSEIVTSSPMKLILESKASKQKETDKFTGKRYMLLDDTLKREFMVHMNDELGDFQRTITESKQHVNDMREQEDIEARRCNVVLYRMPESSAILSEDRRKEDITFCQQFFHGFNVGFITEDMKNVYHLGARQAGTRPRPILVQFANRHIKNLIMESLYKIKSLAMKFKNIVVAHDLTKKQKLECKELVAQAKLRSENESGDFLTESGVHREI